MLNRLFVLLGLSLFLYGSNAYAKGEINFDNQITNKTKVKFTIQLKGRKNKSKTL